MPAHLNDLLAAALATRRALLEQLHAEQTTAYRLFHGSVEGVAGLAVDRYGDALLVQSFHQPLDVAELATLEAFYAGEFPGLPLFYNDRSQANSRITNALPPDLVASAQQAGQVFKDAVDRLRAAPVQQARGAALGRRVLGNQCGCQGEVEIAQGVAVRCAGRV